MGSRGGNEYKSSRPCIGSTMKVIQGLSHLIMYMEYEKYQSKVIGTLSFTSWISRVKHFFAAS